MGANHSSEFDIINTLNDNDALLLFAREIPIPENDPFWNTFLTFSISLPITRELDEEINNKLKPICKTLFLNNVKSGNFCTLLKYIATRLSVESLVPSRNENNEEADTTTCRMFNAMFIVRCFVKYLIEHTNEAELLNHFSPSSLESPNNDSSKIVKFEDYMQILIDAIIKLPITDLTYDLYIEAINSLFVVLSISLFSNRPASQSVAYKYLTKINEAGIFLQTLLQRYIEQTKRPVRTSNGIFYGLASDIWNFFAFHRQSEDEISCPLASHAVLLMLVLINHSTSSSNPYRIAVASYTANVNGLYEVLCQTITYEENTLLLYHLLHTNTNFRNYLLARTDVELMLLPILRRIYNAVDNNCHHIYMSLIILLILTEDQLFNKAIHSMILKGIPWYTERMISEVSLGGLIILVTTRTIQYNLLRTRDKYLHTNCLAALANMSSQFTNLHPYVCQRLLSLFEILTKTHSKINVDVMAVEETIRIILEVINSCLTHQLIHNTNLVYTLLYNKHVFQPFRDHEAFHDIIQNIDLVIIYFSKKLEKENEVNNDVDETLEKVQRWSHQWPRDLLKKLPDLKFKYVEEEKPEEFFMPYVWSLVGKFSGIYWNAALYKL